MKNYPNMAGSFNGRLRRMDINYHKNNYHKKNKKPAKNSRYEAPEQGKGSVCLYSDKPPIG